MKNKKVVSNPKINFPFRKIQPTPIQPTSVQTEGNSYSSAQKWSLNLSQHARVTQEAQVDLRAFS